MREFRFLEDTPVSVAVPGVLPHGPRPPPELPGKVSYSDVRLPGAVRAEEAEDGALGDNQVNPVHRQLVDVAHALDQAGGCRLLEQALSGGLVGTRPETRRNPPRGAVGRFRESAFDADGASRPNRHGRSEFRGDPGGGETHPRKYRRSQRHGWQTSLNSRSC